jgi:hypothetical protein
MTHDETKPAAGAPVRSRALLADDFTFKTHLNGLDIEMNALAAEELCEKLETFGDDCSNGCKRMRAAIRDAINTCTANNPLCVKHRDAAP